MSHQRRVHYLDMALSKGRKTGRRDTGSGNIEDLAADDDGPVSFGRDNKVAIYAIQREKSKDNGEYWSMKDLVRRLR